MEMVMEEIGVYLPVIIPLLIVQLALMVTALVHALRHPNYKIGNKAIWCLAILLISIIGPVLYFAVGRGEEMGEYDD